MVHYPDEQKKLQDEVDKVVGEDRLPDFDDMPQLPRVRAVAKEASVLSTGKLSVESDVYRLFDGVQSLLEAFHTSPPKTMCTKGCIFLLARTSTPTNGLYIAIRRSIRIQRLSSLIGG